MTTNERTEKRQAWASFAATNKAMQDLLMAMARAENSRGKRTLFGRDKHLPALEQFLAQLKIAFDAAIDDGVLTLGTAKPMVEDFVQLLQAFSEAYPNWPDAYRFASRFFSEESNTAESVIQGVLDFRAYLERPMIYRTQSSPEDQQNEWWKPGQ